jgi:hypothetical protein
MTRTRAILGTAAPLSSLLVAVAFAATLAAPAGAALAPSAYRVGRLCSSPPPGYAGCLGLRLVAKHPRSLHGSRASTRRAVGPATPLVERFEFDEPWEGSLSPQNVRSAYSLSGLPAPATQQTLALVDAFDDPTVEHDLKVFDEQFGLPPCTTANGCFTKVAMRSPVTNAGWAQEIATDVEVAHGVCQSCKILLIEAHSNSNPDLEEAEEKAVQLGANEISDSWGGPEQGVSAQADATDAFNHPGTVITAAAGDDGYLDWGLAEASERGFADYPASSPHVVAVGGTRLGLTSAGAWKEETVWNGDGAGGGGCSTALTAPAWQQSLTDWSAVGCGSRRAVADVSADADPYTGVAVYDSTPITEGKIEYSGWVPIGGTSVASPIIASTFALAGGAATGAGGKAVEYPAQTLYENLAANPGSLHDVTSGSNGACAKGFDEQTGASECSLGEEDASCTAHAICLAHTGYDGPTGVGTPHGIAAFQPPAPAAQEPPAEEGHGTEGESEGSSKGGGGSKEGGGAGSGGKGSEEISGGEEGKGGEGPKGGGSESESQGPGVFSPGADALSSAPLAAPGSSSVIPILSALTLTRTATAALNHGRPRISRVAFAFTLNVAARVRVKLAKQVVVHGHIRWQALPDSLTITGRPGRNSARLSAHGALAPGRYRLTLALALGAGRSLAFRVD